MGRATVGLVLLLSAFGCWTEHRGVRGLATLGPSCDETGSGKSPAGSAAQQVIVELRCPGDAAPRRAAVTDVGGRFFVDLEGGELDARCELSLRKEGYLTRRFTLQELCTHALDGDTRCEAASVVAELPAAARAPSATGGASSAEAAP
jgi:hypothetical protein